MTVNSRIMSMLVAVFLIVIPVDASAAPKAKTNAEKVVQGTVVTSTDNNLIIRKGKADVTLMYDSASQKPATLVAGASVLVHYRDEKNQHIVTAVEVTADKAGAGSGPAH